MTLQPLLEAAWTVKLHLVSALGAAGIGVVQLTAPKGVLPHRILGWTFTVLLGIAVATSAFLHGEVEGAPSVFGFSPFHLFTVAVLLLLPLGVWAARTKRVLLHRSAMIGLYAGALLVAGLFALAPGRLAHRSLTGAPGGEREAVGGAFAEIQRADPARLRAMLRP